MVLDLGYRGWRCAIVAVVGCLLAVSAVARPQNGDVGANPDRQPQADQTSADPAPPPGPFQDSRQTGGYRADCREPKDREDSDLCAQWGSVEGVRDANRIAIEAVTAARRANDLSRYGLWLTGFEFSALVATLLFTWLSTRAALQGVRVSRQAYITDQRPWVSATPAASGNAYFFRNKFQCDVKITVNNAGRTPAEEVEVYCGIATLGHHDIHDVVKEYRDKVMALRLERSQTRGDVLFPGEQKSLVRAPWIESEKIEWSGPLIEGRRTAVLILVIVVAYAFKFQERRPITAVAYRFIKTEGDYPFVFLENEGVIFAPNLAFEGCQGSIAE